MKKIFFIILLFITFISCKNNEKEKNTEPIQKIRVRGDTITLNKEQLKNAGILLSVPAEQHIRQTLNASGLVYVPPQNVISISAPMGGYLKSTKLLPGMRIAKGQVIATLEDPLYVQLQEDYLSAKAKMQYVKENMERQKELNENNATSTKNYQLALSEYNQLQVQIQALTEKLRLINVNPAKVSLAAISRQISVYAPVSGFVSKVNVNMGMYVSPSEELFELINPNEIQAAITIFEKDILHFKPGMKGTVWLSNDTGKKYAVNVSLVSKNLTNDRSALVYCRFPDVAHHLLPGMFLNAEFDILSYHTKAIPEEAVVHFEGNDYVFIAGNDSTFIMKKIEAGIPADGFIALRTDSLFNEKIVSKGAFNLLGAVKGGEE